MEEVQKESLLTGYPNIISYESTKKILKQMEKNICKINLDNEQGTGFFCKIPFPNEVNMLPVLITNNHVINDQLLNKKDAKISIYIEDQNSRKIDLNNRMKYTNEEFDITIIEIKDKDDINNFLELDDDLIDNIINNEDKNDKYKKETIYIIQYPEGKLSVSYGILNNIYEDKKYNFTHKCSTKFGSSGSPILNINNNKVIGVHKEGIINSYNKGTFLNYPIKIFIEQNINKINKIKEGKTSEVIEKDKVKFDVSASDTITMLYDIKQLKEENKNNKEKKNLQILGKKFVDNNKSSYFFFTNQNLKIIYKNKEYKFESYIDIDKIEEEDFAEIKLKGINDIIYKNSMFCGCEYLIKISDIPYWITSKNNDISYMFKDCKNLKNLPDISNWDTSKVTDMGSLFSGCESLLSLPDISKWNISRVTNISYMFYCCYSLFSFPDISKWDTSKVIDMSYMFSNGISNTLNVVLSLLSYKYSKLTSLPDISKWDTSNVNSMVGVFSGCESLLSLPDISKWKVSKVKNINSMFYGCKKITSLPDISKWNTSNIKDMNHLFCHCQSLVSLPDISKWDISKVTNVKFMFYNCKSLSSLPDISKWNVFNIKEFVGMFHGCTSLPKSSFNNIKNWSPYLFDEAPSCLIF